MNTLFGNVEDVCSQILNRYSLFASKEFIECADKQLTEKFTQLTGLKPGKNVELILGSGTFGLSIYQSYQGAPNQFGTRVVMRKLNLQLCINNNWNDITIFWKSKSDKDIKLHSIDIDPNDVEFWFGELDTALYLKQLYPDDKLPFKPTNLSFTLIITRINPADCTLNIQLSEGKFEQIDIVISKLSQFIEDFNQKSEQANRKYGVVHNSDFIKGGNGDFLYRLDLGSTGIPILKKLFKFMSEMNVFKSVGIE